MKSEGVSRGSRVKIFQQDEVALERQLRLCPFRYAENRSLDHSGDRPGLSLSPENPDFALSMAFL